MNDRISFYAFGGKPRILAMILVTAALGFFLGQAGIQSWHTFWLFMFGTTLACNGASILNQFLERESDSQMARTRMRPIPAGRISPMEGLIGGLALTLGGGIQLALTVNLLSAFLARRTSFLYVLGYTPLERLSWLNTVIGAIPGAIPPLGGWAAATGNLSPGAWVLFLIVFLWQHPHFYAIAWMYKDDYAKGGLKMLPVVDPGGGSTFRQIIVLTWLLIFASLIPAMIGVSGYWYLSGTIACGVLFLVSGITLARTKTIADARKVLRVSVIYLPVVLTLIAIDVNF